jgi:hypothetical protein
MRAFAVLLLALVAAVAGAFAAPPAAAARPLTTAVFPTSAYESDLTYQRIRGTGAGVVRLILPWNVIAPAQGSGTRPAGFVPADPFDAAYDWGIFDRRAALARARGLEVIASVYGAPRWAQGPLNGSTAPTTEDYLRGMGTVRPIPAELGAFAAAAAERYSGRHRGLPRVRYWQLWNEPNLIYYLSPQVSGTRAESPAIYRAMLNAFADAVHRVDRTNLVVAGGTAPFTSRTGSRQLYGLGPLRFMRELLCLSESLRPTCADRARFDVWAHHPYTSGGPTRKARFKDDVSLGDLPRMRALLTAAVRHRKIVSSRPLQFWVTEFSWDTSPPDPKGVPARLHARWTSEALYRMWSNGVSLATWFQLRDDPFVPGSFYQSGLYFRGAALEQDRPKLSHQAFRFPFVALRQPRQRVLVWGRTPTSRAGTVVIERNFRGGWARVAVVRANRHGIFTARVKDPKGGSMRARFGNQRSVGFALKRPPDRSVSPFGTGWDD